MSTIVFLNAYILLEGFLYFNGVANPVEGISYLFYHFTGPLFLLFTYYLFKIEFKERLFYGLFGGYTLLRATFLLFYVDEIDLNDNSLLGNLPLVVDYFVMFVIDVMTLLRSYRIIKEINFSVELNKQEELNYRWIKSLLLVSLGFYGLVLINDLLSVIFDFSWMLNLKIESLLTCMFVLVAAFFATRFPVFAVYGDFNDMGEEPKKKYANSSLKSDGAEQIWQNLTQIMEREKPYQDPDFRLNDLAQKTKSSVHHVSQVINEHQGLSFSDFVNQYRIEEAKKMLVSEKMNYLTIQAISFEVGFNSKTAFYNAFKKFTGQTPSAYRKASVNS